MYLWIRIRHGAVFLEQWQSPWLTKCNTLKAEIRLFVQNSSPTSQKTKLFFTKKISQEMEFRKMIGVYGNNSVRYTIATVCGAKNANF